MQESTVYQSIVQEARTEEKREIALKLLQRGADMDLITASTGLSIATLQQLQLQLTEDQS